ncbi:MAG: hypothetical protein CMC02_13440, partial [Flavobacteriaceae bacterium]|nr:hypothetical protein [Flavobacteriaceae bacterium]
MSFPCLYGQQENFFKEETSLRLSQSKLSDRIYGVGKYKHFKNNFEFMKQNFLKLEVFVGILEHYDFMTA